MLLRQAVQETQNQESQELEFHIEALGEYSSTAQQFICSDKLPLHISASGNNMFTYSATTNSGKDNDQDDKST